MKTEMSKLLKQQMAANRIAAAQGEKWHVRYWSTNFGRREGYGVMRESERNVSGTRLYNFNTREEAQAVCDSHNIKFQ